MVPCTSEESDRRATGFMMENSGMVLQRLKHNGASTFEMLAVRAKSNGMEIEFTEPLQEGEGWSKSNYLVKQWYYQPTENYGGPKIDEKSLNIRFCQRFRRSEKSFSRIRWHETKSHGLYQIE